MSSSFRALLAAAALLAPAAQPATARSCTIAGNVVPNCGFDVNDDGWFMTTDLATWVGSDCATGPGCMTLERWTFNGSIEAISSCIDVSPSGYWAFGASIRLDNGAASNGCFLSFTQASNDNCSAFLSETFFARPVDATWSEQMAGIATSGATQALQLKLVCSSNVDFLLRIDDFFVMPAVFVDGFESGNRNAWSSTTP